jgi:inorganic pyrophosphatase
LTNGKHRVSGPLDTLSSRTASGLVNIIIDTPKGSRNKFKYDAEANCFRLSRILPAGASFPHDFGCIPQTLAEDGDALDVLVLSDDLPATHLDQIEHFFVSYNRAHGRGYKPIARLGPDQAEAVLAAAEQRYLRQKTS